MMPKASKPVLGGREIVRVAIVQKAPAFMDREASLARAEKLIAEAAEGGTDLIVFPEVWLSGYPYWTEGWDSPLQQWAGGRVRFRDAAIVAPSEDTERLGAAARKAGAYVVMGCNEMDPRPEVSTIYNALLFFDRDGRLLARHRYGNVPVRVVALPAATKDQRVYPIERIRGDAPPPGGYAGVAEDLATAPGKRRVAW